MVKKPQKPRPLRACTYCGKVEDPDGPRFTRDHVLPRALFNVMDPQMITVLACGACQEEKRYGDDDLRDFVNLHYAGSHHPEAWPQLLKIMQSTLEGHSKIGRALMTQRQLRARLSDSGLYLGDVWEAPIPNENRDMFKTLEYIVRGLYFDAMKARLPPDTPVSVAHIDTLEAPEILRPLTQLPHRGPTIKGHVVAWWVSYHPHEDPLSTFWVIVFNDSVHFLAGTGALARDVDQLGVDDDADGDGGEG